MNCCVTRRAYSKFGLLKFYLGFYFYFHWALSQLLYAQTLKVSQEYVAILGPLFSTVNVYNLNQEHTCPTTTVNHRLVGSRSSEPSLTVAAKLLLLTASPHLAKSSCWLGWEGGWEMEASPQIPNPAVVQSQTLLRLLYAFGWFQEC